MPETPIVDQNEDSIPTGETMSCEDNMSQCDSENYEDGEHDS